MSLKYTIWESTKYKLEKLEYGALLEKKDSRLTCFIQGDELWLLLGNLRGIEPKFVDSFLSDYDTILV